MNVSCGFSFKIDMNWSIHSFNNTLLFQISSQVLLTPHTCMHLITLRQRQSTFERSKMTHHWRQKVEFNFSKGFFLHHRRRVYSDFVEQINLEMNWEPKEMWKRTRLPQDKSLWKTSQRNRIFKFSCRCHFRCHLFIFIFSCKTHVLHML